MSKNTEISFEEMSQSFQRAFGYASVGHYRQSIPLYEKAIREDKYNFSALNNLAIAKINVGIEERKKELIQTAISHLKEAIIITKEIHGFADGFLIAENNLIWAEKELSKLS